MRWLRRLIVVFLVGLLGLYPLLAPVPHRIDKVHCDLIKTGMTKDEAASIFGAPPGDYDFAQRKPSFPAARSLILRSRRVSFVHLSGVKVNMRIHHSPYIWIAEWTTWTGRHGAFNVGFDQHGRVVTTSGPSEVNVVPPWQRWWKKLTE